MTGKELRELREEWKLTQPEFGRLFGLSADTIANLERGRRKITESLQLHIDAERKLRAIEKILHFSG